MTIADDLSVLSTYGVFSDFGDAKGNEDLQQILVLRDFGREVADRIAREIGELRGRGELSEVGMRRRAADLASSVLEEIARAEGLLQHRADNVRRMRQALSITASDDGDKAALAVQLAEVRRFLLDRLEPDERISTLVESVERGDSLVFRAFAEAPTPMRGLLIGDEQFLTSAIAEWGSKRNPERANEVARLERALDEAARSLTAARGIATGIAGGELPQVAVVNSDDATRRANADRRERQAEALEAEARRQARAGSAPQRLS